MKPLTKSLARDSAWVLVGQSLYALSQWIIISLLAKMTSTDDVGDFSFALALSAPVIMLLNMDLRSLAATDPEGLTRTRDYYLLRRLTSVIAIVFLMSMVLVYPSLSTTQRMVVALISIAKVVESVGDIRLGTFQRAMRLDLVSRSLTLRAISSVTFVWIALRSNWGLLGACFALFAGWLLVLLAHDLRISREIFTVGSPGELSGSRWSRLKEMSSSALPLGIAMMLVSLQTNVPRIVLAQGGATSLVGIFSALFYPWALGSLIVHSLGNAIAPRLPGVLHSHDPRAIYTLIGKLIALGVGIGVIGIFLAFAFGPWVISWVYTAEYAEHLDVFLLLGVASTFGYAGAFVRHALVAMRRLRGYLVVTAISTVVLLAMCIGLVPTYQMVGAAIAMILMLAVQLVGSLGLLLMKEAAVE